MAYRRSTGRRYASASRKPARRSTYRRSNTGSRRSARSGGTMTLVIEHRTASGVSRPELQGLTEPKGPSKAKL